MTDDMAAVLGLDAAWTPGGSSGVALAGHRDGVWRCLAVASSYDAFCALGGGRMPQGAQWRGTRPGGTANVPALLDACEGLLTAAGCAGGLAVVAVDMPLARHPIVGRRPADNAAAKALAPYRCGVHSPSPIRPGPLGAALVAAFAAQGFSLATADGLRPVPALLEVYPHAEFIGLQREDGGQPRTPVRRLAYKASRSTRYWPQATREARLDLLLRTFDTIRTLLGRVMTLPDIPLPAARETTLAGLKPYEDGLDALACCATGIRYLEGRARALGDADGAIWVPEGM